MPDPQKKACTLEHGRISLLNLPENLISSIFRYLPTKEKCQAELVCKTFREVLGNPTPGAFVWYTVSLDDPVFQRISLNELSRQASSDFSFRYLRPQVAFCHLSMKTPAPSLCRLPSRSHQTSASLFRA